MSMPDALFVCGLAHLQWSSLAVQKFLFDHAYDILKHLLIVKLHYYIYFGFDFQVWHIRGGYG